MTASGKRKKTLSEVGEWGLLAQLEQFYPVKNKRLVVGFGDDVAVIDPSPQQEEYLVATVDAMVEGTHFVRGEYDPYVVGRKLLAVNLSDIAAVGAIPEFFMVSIAAPKNIAVNRITTIFKGLRDEAQRYGVILVNGDTVGGNRLHLSLTLLGKKPKNEHLPLRSSARSGQFIYITGTPGDSGAGLQLLLDGEKPRRGSRLHTLLEQHLSPEPRIEEGRAVARHFSDTAMIDVSDGVYHELCLISRFSSIGCEISLEAIPLSDQLVEYCTSHHKNPLDFALYGGEDYELIFTTKTSPETVSRLFKDEGTRTPVTCIGKTTKTGKVMLLDKKGALVKPRNTTFSHF